MKNFTYAKATDKAQALALLADFENAYVVAGATNVMLNIRDQKVNDRTLVDVRPAADLRYIKDAGQTIELGALTTIKDLEKSALIQKEAKALWQAAVSFADPTTRNSATVGGNICNASPAADTATPLLVLDAVVRIEKQGAVRELPLVEFFLGVGKTALQAGEMVTAITIKKAANCGFVKLGLRNAMAISVANAAVCCTCQDGKVLEARIAMGSVAPTPVRCYNAEKAVVGTAADEDAIAAALLQDICPIDDIRATGRYRKQVAPVLVSRAFKAACGCKEGGADHE